MILHRLQNILNVIEVTQANLNSLSRETENTVNWLIECDDDD